MRDKRFVAIHRGGTLDLATHRLLAVWAAECAEHVLTIFQTCSSDDRPRRAIAAAKAWAKGKISVGEARKAAVAAHDAARKVKNKSAIAVARAAGHAVATAHMADHCFGGSLYALKAVEAAGRSVECERAWQFGQISEKLRTLIVSGQRKRLAKLRSEHFLFQPAKRRKVR